MPGAPWTGRNRPLAERTQLEIVVVFIAFPLLLCGILLTMVIRNVADNARDFTTSDWLFQAAWAGLLALGLAIALPVVGWQELKRRASKRKRARGPEFKDGAK